MSWPTSTQVDPQQVPVQERRREEDGERRECRPVVEQSRAYAPTPLAQGHARDDN
jgi:hypothetical protein